MAGVQLLAAGTILVGGAVAFRSVHLSVEHDRELAAVHDRTTAAATSDTERYVLDRSSKLASAFRSPDVPAIMSAVLDGGTMPNPEADRLPPLARAEFADQPSSPPAPIEVATLEPAEPIDMPTAKSELASSAANPPRPTEPSASMLAAPAAISADQRPSILQAVLSAPLPSPSSIAPAPQGEARHDDVATSSPKPKLKLQEAEAKKRHPGEPDKEPRITRRTVEARYIPERRHGNTYTMPIRVAATLDYRTGPCAGGPARWVGNRIYWGRRC